MAIEYITVIDASGVVRQVAADQLGTAFYQVFKLALGADGAAALVSPGQQLAANSVPVVPPSDLPDATYIGDIKFGEALPAGTAAIGKLAANSGVDIGDVDVLSVVPGVAATNLGKAEDAVHTSGDTGVMSLAVRKDVPVALAGADGDYCPPLVDARGRTWVRSAVGATLPNDVFGVTWDPTSTSPTLTRVGAAAGMAAAVGINAVAAVNDFDGAPIWGEITEWTDTLGNTFMRFPKVYIKHVRSATFCGDWMSKTRYPGFYLPKFFWNFTTKAELDYGYYGKHLASKNGSLLASVPDVFPLVSDTIIHFRSYAQANNAGGLLGYQQECINAYDVLLTAMGIEFATHDLQSVLTGFTAGQYSASHTATVDESTVNRIIVANATADLYRVGQTIGIGTSLGGGQVCSNRVIASIDVYDASNKAISFDGATVNIAIGNILYNRAWRTGFSRGAIAASSGCIGANDGKYPAVYRGIEEPYGGIYRWIDGVNLSDRRAWVCADAESYQSDLFTTPYEQLAYLNAAANGYAKTLGFDPAHPAAQFPTAVDASSGNARYRDYHYQDAGQRGALVGGYWNDGTAAGPFFWRLGDASSYASVSIGGRLLKKAL